MAGAVAAPPNPERARTKSDEGVMSWLTGNAPGEPHDDKENEATPSRTRWTPSARRRAPHAILVGPRPPVHVRRGAAHVIAVEEMSPKKRGWWGGVRDVMKGGQRSIDTIKLAKNMGDEQKKYKERSKRELDAWEEKYKFDKDTDEAKGARRDREEEQAPLRAHGRDVHRDALGGARQQVLVKVQHVGVRDALRADVAILPYLIQFVDNLDPNHGLRPLMYMISSMLEQEVDFRIEGANASGSRPSAACPPLGAALYGFGAFVRHAKNAVTAAVGGAAGLACFFLGEHFAEVDFGAELKRNLKSMFKDPKMVARLEQAFTFHQQTRSKVDKAIAETADVRFELIIIDHGFHTHVTYEYRLAWCKVWAGIGLCDEELLKEGCADFGLEGDDYKKMTMILSFFRTRSGARFCRLSEFLGYLKSGNEHGLVATQEVTNRKLPKQFHLMHRTSQQIAAHFNAEYGMGYELVPLPRAHDQLPPSRRMRLDFVWDRSMSKNASVDKDSNIWALFAKDEAEKWKKWIADDAEKHAQLAMDARRVSLGMSEDDFKAKVAEESGGAAIYVPPAPEEAPDKGETADGDDDKQKK
ncbi:hypothetical protein JL722_15244 [Aureococcus anophagefferens]|nr:hypothetical protein JL722_15244 [Aureococcus anophagefferens]